MVNLDLSFPTLIIMERVIFFGIVVSLITCHPWNIYYFNPYVDSFTAQMKAPFTPLSNNKSLSESSYKFNIWNKNPALPVTKAHSIYISVPSISFSNILSPQYKPFYRCQVIDDGSHNSLTVKTTFTVALNVSLIQIAYLAVDKPCPLYFRAFQHNLVIPSNKSVDLINYTKITNETLPLSLGLKVIFSIIGTTFSLNVKTPISIYPSLIFLDSSGIKYNISKLDPYTISGITVSIAVFQTFTVFQQKIYLFDAISYEQTQSVIPQIKVPYGIGPEYTGVIGQKIPITGLSYSYQRAFYTTFYNISQFLHVKLNDSVSKITSSSTNIVVSYFLHGIFTCESFVSESTLPTCQNTCSSTLAQQSVEKINWSINCNICITARVCTINYCGNGYIDPSEECDLDLANGQFGSGCSNDCNIVGGYYCTQVNGFGSICSPRCGDGIVAIGKQTCDYGGSQDGKNKQGCSKNCSISTGFYCNITIDLASECYSRCGDGLTAGEQQCDQSEDNGKAGFGCSSNCTSLPGYYCIVNDDLSSSCWTVCGDALTAGTETCDLGRYNGRPSSGCTSDCQIVYGFKCNQDYCFTSCGDKIVAGNEACDTGSINEGCSPNCTVLPGYYCKNNIYSTCTTQCGDGIVQGIQLCDLGIQFNTVGYGCSKDCTVNRGFQCTTTLNLTSVCTSTCGDGIVAGDQTCDYGSSSNGLPLNACSRECKVLPGFYCSITTNLTSYCVTYCGDGYTSGSELCDYGNNGGIQNYGKGCAIDCTPKEGYHCIIQNYRSICQAKCGDGIVRELEACDTENFTNPQIYGCFGNCSVVPGFYCVTGPKLYSICTTQCGDGIAVAAFETCDKGKLNGEIASGCTLNCTEQQGWKCNITNFISECDIFCGDGILAGNQECDQGDKNGGQFSGCSSKCKIIAGFKCQIIGTTSKCFPDCGDEMVVGSEQCDYGQLNGLINIPCTDKCLLVPGYYNCSTLQKANNCSTDCGDYIVAGNEECDLGPQNGSPTSICSNMCTLKNNTCLQIDPTFTCIFLAQNTKNMESGSKI